MFTLTPLTRNFITLLQDEKNQLLITNIWLKLVRTIWSRVPFTLHKKYFVYFAFRFCTDRKNPIFILKFLSLILLP